MLLCAALLQRFLTSLTLRPRYTRTSRVQKYVYSLYLLLQEAEWGAQKTVEMTAKAGRSSYVKAGDLKVPDPGAVAVSLWLRAAAEALK